MFALTYGIAATALAADQAGHPNALSRWIAPLGVLTYGIYMLHPIIRSLGYPLMMAAGFESNLAITICGLFVLPAAYLSYVWFENPARRWISRSEEHTSELQSLMRISYAVFCLKKKNNNK